MAGAFSVPEVFFLAIHASFARTARAIAKKIITQGVTFSISACSGPPFPVHCLEFLLATRSKHGSLKHGSSVE